MGLKLNSIKNTVSDEGEWQDCLEWPGVKFKVRSINSRDYVIARDLLVQRKVKALKRAPTGPELEPQLGQLVARHLLRGWEGIDGDDDKPLLYSPDKAIELLADPDYRKLEEQVILAASNVGDVEAEFTEEAAKN